MVHQAKPSDTGPTHKPLPDDCDIHYSPSAVSWLTKYGLAMDACIRWGIKYSAKRNQIIFTWPDMPLWQARNMDREYVTKDGVTKKLPKYFTSGDHTDYCPVYTSLPLGFISDTLVIVEDCVSAIKIASGRAQIGLQCDSMPLLGSHLPTKKLMALRGYKRFVVWLDHDKGKTALDICNKACMLNIGTNVVMTKDDPKDHTYEQLKELIQ